VTSIEDYGHAEYWKQGGWVAPWLIQANPAYWPEMIACIGEHWINRKDWQSFFLTDKGRAALRVQLCTRISQASDVFVPWLEQAIALDGLRVLEIGCGSGSSTAGLARAGARVTGVDVKGKALVLARKRMSLLGFEASFIEAKQEWLEFPVDVRDFGGPYDLVVCYALLEHLQIGERLNLLTMIGEVMRRDGAKFTVFETPNRFAPFDWHSSKLAFSEVLPDELAYEYIRRRSPKQDHPAHLYELYSAEARRNIYRRGRGVSWHEFELTWGLSNIEILLDGYSPRSQQKNYKADAAYEAALAELFAGFDPPVPRAFCRPSLELLIKFR